MHTALIIMDVQRTTVSYLGKGQGEEQAYLNRLVRTINAARKAGMMVIYVTARFREGYPEVSPHNRLFSRSLKAGFLPSSELEIHPAIAPKPGDIVVTKLRASAFTGSDLEVVLRSQAINHLVLCGLITSGVVLATVQEAADKDYELTVLSDGCADVDEEVQRVLMTKIFPRQATVTTIEEWCQQVADNS